MHGIIQHLFSFPLLNLKTKKMKKVALCLLSALLLFSCKKDENPENISTVYFPLQKGNYWIYESVQVNRDGSEKPLDGLDSLSVTGDSIINGISYSVISGKEYHDYSTDDISYYFYRDSSGYIVDNYGRTRFSETNFTDILLVKYTIVDQNDTIVRLTCRMEKPENNVVTKAGSFSCLNYRGTIDTVSSQAPKDIKYPRYLNNYYAKNIGLVLKVDNIYFSDPSYIEKRLVRYYVR